MICPRRLFLIQNKNYWTSFEQSVSTENYLVFAIDFGLYLQLKKDGFHVFLFDCYLDKNYLQVLNEKMHFF